LAAIRSRLARLVSIGAAACLAACGYEWAHPEPAPVTDGKAHIGGVSVFNPDGGFTQAAVCAVDGQELAWCETELAVAPGRHELRIRIWGLHHFIPTSIDVACDLAPGRVPLGGFVSARGMKPMIPGCSAEP